MDFEQLKKLAKRRSSGLGGVPREYVARVLGAMVLSLLLYFWVLRFFGFL